MFKKHFTLKLDHREQKNQANQTLKIQTKCFENM